MIRSKLVILLTLFSFVSYAGEVTFIKAKEPAPYDGYLMTPAKTNEVKNVVIERDGLLKLNESLNKSLQLQSDVADLNQKKVTILLEQQETLSKSLYDERSMSNWVQFGWFALGVVAAGAAVYGAHQAYK